MGVGNPEHLKHALNRAVLPADPVQSIENYIRTRFECAQQCRQIAAGVDHPHRIAAVSQRHGALVPGR